MNNNNNKKIYTFKFGEEIKEPTYKYNNNKGIVEWGDNNDYPSFLVDIFNFKGSSAHKAIINKKNQMKTSMGVQNYKNSDFNRVSENSLNKTLERCGLDDELFNGFCFELVYSKTKKLVNIKHIPFQNVRVGIENEKNKEPHFWYSADWTNVKKNVNKPQYIKAYDNTNTGNQLMYVKRYTPGDNTIYPIPNYSEGLNYINLDYEIGKFHINSAKNGYIPSVIISFLTGEPTEEEKEENYKNIKKNFSGTDNAGKAMITYGDGSDQIPSITPFPTNDSDERFNDLAKNTLQQVMVAHEVTNPQLFGIRVPGELGGQQNIIESLDIFKEVYVYPRQKLFISTFSEILHTDIVFNEFEITSKNTTIDEKTKILDAIVLINKQIKSGELDQYTAINILTTVYGFTEELAEKIIITV